MCASCVPTMATSVRPPCLPGSATPPSRGHLSLPPSSLCYFGVVGREKTSTPGQNVPQSRNLSNKLSGSRRGAGDSWQIAADGPCLGPAQSEGVRSSIMAAGGNAARGPRRPWWDTPPGALPCCIYNAQPFGNRIRARACLVVRSGDAV